MNEARTLVVLDETLVRALLNCISLEKDRWDSSTSWPALDEAQRQLQTALDMLEQARKEAK